MYIIDLHLQEILPPLNNVRVIAKKLLAKRSAKLVGI
jgi:hypothetical protein